MPILALLQSPPPPHVKELFFGVTVFCVAIVAGLGLHYAVFQILSRIRKTEPRQQPRRLLAALQRLNQPARVILLLTGVAFALPIAIPWLHIPQSAVHIVYKTVAVLWFASLGWLMITAVYMAEDLMVSRYDITISDNLRARRVRTQMQLLRRMAISLLIVLDIGLILSAFPSIWHYGAGLLASAGLATLVLATAAKSTAENFLAGLQIALYRADPARRRGHRRRRVGQDRRDHHHLRRRSKSGICAASWCR
jgi:small-conductance mechanosensitive channel